MRKKFYLVFLIIMTLVLTSCRYDAIAGVKLSELPWGELRPIHFFEYPTIISILYLPIVIYITYREIFLAQWAGKKIMKMKLKNFNYPFWFLQIGWIGFIWLAVIQIDSDVRFFTESLLPQEVMEVMLLLMILKKALFFFVLLLFVFWMSLRLFRQPEIREKGIIHGLLLLSWENISLAEWREPGTLKIHYRLASKPLYLLLRKKNKEQEEKEIEYCLEIKPEQEADVNKYLYKYIPNQIIDR